MLVQCKICKKIRDNGEYRHPWPGELPLKVQQSYCPDCAKETLESIQHGETPFIYQELTRQAAS